MSGWLSFTSGDDEVTTGDTVSDTVSGRDGTLLRFGADTAVVRFPGLGDLEVPLEDLEAARNPRRSR